MERFIAENEKIFETLLEDVAPDMPVMLISNVMYSSSLNEMVPHHPQFLPLRSLRWDDRHKEPSLVHGRGTARGMRKRNWGC